MYYFSIIMPAFNSARTIARAIASVQNQGFQNWELIIVNDGSTDSTNEIVSRFSETDPRIRQLFQRNKKQAAARNFGISESTGKWIAFLDSDDEWLPGKLSMQLKVIEDDDCLDVIYSDGYTQFEDRKNLTNYHYEVLKGKHVGIQMYSKLMIGNPIPMPSAIVKRQFVDLVGKQDESYEAVGCEDHDLWLRLTTAGARFYGAKEKLFIYHVREDSTSSDALRQDFSSAYIRIKNFNPKWLSPKEIIAFKENIRGIILMLKSNARMGWATFLKEELKNNSIIIAHSILNDPNKQFEVMRRLSAQVLKKMILMLLVLLYFKPKKILGFAKHRIHTRYILWLYSKNIKVQSYFRIMASTVLHMDKNTLLFTNSLHISDYSFLNLYGEQGKLITGSRVKINRFCNFNIHGKVTLGDNVLFNNYCALNCFQEIEIGDDTWFGEGVKLYDHNHKYKDGNIPFTAQGYSTGKIRIGKNVWIGSNTVILKNVEIGENCVIGANNLIYKSVPANSIVKSSTGENTSFILRAYDL